MPLRMMVRREAFMAALPGLRQRVEFISSRQQQHISQTFFLVVMIDQSGDFCNRLDARMDSAIDEIGALQKAIKKFARQLFQRSEGILFFKRSRIEFHEQRHAGQPELPPGLDDLRFRTFRVTPHKCDFIRRNIAGRYRHNRFNFTFSFPDLSLAELALRQLIQNLQQSACRLTPGESFTNTRLGQLAFCAGTGLDRFLNEIRSLIFGRLPPLRAAK